ncbi:MULTISPECIES: flagellar motor protein MotB [Deefgea]|uniref:Flagellar motor protein MotB n=1 Tax=Deefgea chitinilytica TaxID=570276 RepID=A0ABS2C8P1_9NEIS|nr:MULTISPECIES: flagellar motor protein MotB [Deefgea]MBM5570521.1 flagellar motor protein MotB [Deefgea chitinilytica]MBM9887750.1 flagellar motor protein MotB [Deefgea sp. CFH1-16]
MSDDSQRPIVVKKIKKGGHGHHGGAWKIAYADFVTAMMAFFLLMWLLGSVSKGNLKGISDFFNNPLKVANAGGSGSGDSNSVIQGGGNDITKQAGQVKKGDPPVQTEAAQDKKRLSELKQKFEALMNDKIRDNSKLGQYKEQIKLDMVAEGLRIQIVDEQNRPMFKSGSSELENHAHAVLQEIAQLLNEVPNAVSLAGHTDGTQFAGGAAGFTNWELSSERANSLRRELILGGFVPGKVLRVNGFGDVIPLDKNNVYNPINRRISIVVLNKEAESDIRKLAGQTEGLSVTGPADGFVNPIQQPTQ